MILEQSLVIVVCALWQATGYPYYPYYGNNYDTLSYGSSDNTRGGMVLSRYFNPYYGPRSAGAGMAAFMFKQPEEPQVQQVPSSQYYLPDRRRQTQEENFFPQQNEVYYPQSPQAPQTPEKPRPTEPTELADPTEKFDLIPTTAKAIVPELVEPEAEEVEETVKPKKRVSKRKQVKRPVEDEEEDDDYQPKMPAGAFFPMFFGWGGRGASGGMPGTTAIANAYSTGRGGVATSHATAYGPRPDFNFKDYKDFKPQP